MGIDMKASLYLIMETEKARQLQKEQERGQIPRPVAFWIPRSVVKSCLKFPKQPGEKYQLCELEIEEWFARKAGLA